MKKINFAKDDLNNLNGLSCIENFLLFAFKKEKFAYQYLFFESYLSFYEILKAFIDEKTTFAYFNKIRRIQSVAEEFGIIEIFNNKSIDFSFFDEHDYISVMVKSEYIKEKYNTELWRQDHFILLSKTTDGQYTYLNDTPRDIGLLSREQLKDIFAGQVFAFDINKNFDSQMQKNVFNKFIKNFNCSTNKFEFHVNDFINARDIIGICRILRKRLYDFCSQYIDVEFLLAYLSELDKFYVNLEYMRIRDRIDYNKINETLRLIEKKDRHFIIAIKDKFERMNINECRSN